MLGLEDMQDPSALDHVALMDTGVSTAAALGAPLSSPISESLMGCGVLQSGWFSLKEPSRPFRTNSFGAFN